MLILLIVGVLLLAYANGANDNIKPLATVYGSGTLRYRGALALATASQLVGSALSFFLAGALLKAFSGKGLLPTAIVGDPTFLVAVGLGAAGTVLLATRCGMPVSTTHAIIGGLVGGGLSLAPSQVAWGRLGSTFLLPLLLSPLAALALAALIYPLASRARRRLGVGPESCVCLNETADPRLSEPAADLALLSSATRSVELRVAIKAAHCAPYTGRLMGLSAQQVLDTAHLFSACALGLARGLNDTPKILGILLAAAAAGQTLGPASSFALVAVAMALGGVVHSRALAVTMGRRITELNHGQGFVANLVGAGLVIGATLSGFGVSTTHCTTGAIFGIGAWTGKSNPRVIGGIVLAWLVTLPLGALLAFLVGHALQL